MVLQGKLAIGVLDLLGAGAARHAEYFIKIALTHGNAAPARLVVQNGGGAFLQRGIETAVFGQNFAGGDFTQGGDDLLVLGVYQRLIAFTVLVHTLVAICTSKKRLSTRC